MEIMNSQPQTFSVNKYLRFLLIFGSRNKHMRRPAKAIFLDLGVTVAPRDGWLTCWRVALRCFAIGSDLTLPGFRLRAEWVLTGF